MTYDMELGKRIHEAIVPKGKTFDIRQAADILLGYLSEMLRVSEDRFTNKVFFWSMDDYSRIIQDREFCHERVKKLLGEIDAHVFCSLMSLTKWMEHHKSEIEAKEKQHKKEHTEDMKKLKAEIERLQKPIQSEVEPCKK